MRRVAVVVLACGAFIGCGPKVFFKGGEALLKGEALPEARVPDSLRASIELTGFQGLRKTTVSAAFSAVPRKKYRMDVYGLPGMVEATFHWADTGWTLVIHGREGYLRGYGDDVELPGLGLGKVPVHDLFACLWGDFFPGDGATSGDGGSAGATGGTGKAGSTGAGGGAGKSGSIGADAAFPAEGSAVAAGHSGAVRSAEGTGNLEGVRSAVDTGSAPAGARPEEPAAVGDRGSAENAGGPVTVFPARWERSEGVVRYSGNGFAWAAKVEPATGLVREAVREDSAFLIRYEDYVLRNGRPLPRRVKVFGGKKPLLEIAVKDVEDNPAWKRDPFLLKIPKGFVRLWPARGD
jgi:hypothetical protein